MSEVPDEISGLHAQSAVLLDADSGRVLYEKNGYEVKAMASTTKIMTCIITLENGNLDDVVTVSSYAASQPKVHLGMRSNEQYRLGDLLYSLMLESHNDTAVAIAEHVGGSVEGFAELMNAKAKELGCENTNFVTPNGLDADGHMTTAAELALIGRYAVQSEEFNEITNTSSYSFSTTDGSRSFSVTNRDLFLGQMEGAFGIKTGFTGQAGYCFVGALKRDDRTFISVVLASGWPPDKSWKWADTQKLMDYGLEYYTYKEFSDSNASFEPVLVIDGQSETVDLWTEDTSFQMLLRQDEDIEIVYDFPDELQAPVTRNEQVGSVQFLLNGELYIEKGIYTQEDVPQIDYNFCFKQILNLFLIEKK